MKNRIVVVRGAGPEWNPLWFTDERCDEIRARNPIAYLTDVLGEFTDPETGWLSPVHVSANTREYPLELPAVPGGRYSAAIDTSGGSSTGNPNCLVIVRSIRGDDSLAYYRVAAVREWRGVDPEALWLDVAATLRPFGLGSVSIDQYAASQNISLARQAGVFAHAVPWNAQNKLQSFTDVATLIHSGRIELISDRQFQRDLLSVKKRAKANGFEIVLPKTADGRHSDYAPAFVMAIAHAISSVSIASFMAATRRLSSTNSVRQQLSNFCGEFEPSRRRGDQVQSVLTQTPEQRALGGYSGGRRGF